MDKIPTVAEWVTIIEAIGDQCVRVEWAANLSGGLFAIMVIASTCCLIVLIMFLGKKFWDW